MTKRIMVDMSVTLIHHGHIRLLKRVAEVGRAVVALTTDDELEKTKGYRPELNFEQRKEIMESIKYVDEVVPCRWLIDEAFLDQHKCDFLAHGDDNVNHIPPERLIIFPRTEGISSSGLRERVLDALVALNLSDKSSDSAQKIARILIETIKKEFRLE